MISKVIEVLEKLNEKKGFRKALWLLLLIGVTLLFFESNTQYFASTSLQTRGEILITLSKVQTESKYRLKIDELHRDLIKETEVVFNYSNNPILYIFDRLLRFLKGAYIVFPLFYLIFKLTTHLLKNIDEEKHQLFALAASSIALSALAWFATILGSISIIWNSSDSFFISWFLFPFVSALVLLLFVLTLFVLRLVVPKSESK